MTMRLNDQELLAQLAKSGYGIISYDQQPAPLIKPKKQPRQHLEHDAQVAFFQWCDQNIYRCPELAYFFAVPNGGHRHPSVGKMLKREGVKAGIPDVFFLGAKQRFNFLAIEAKIGDNQPSPNQLYWHIVLAELGGKIIVAHGSAEMIQAACDYLEVEP